jgi:hypothetical protein
MDIPEIVKEFVLKHCKRMPETQQEIDQYLDLINHAKDYQTSLVLSNLISKKMLKKLGFKSPNQIKEEGKKLFYTPETQTINK